MPGKVGQVYRTHPLSKQKRAVDKMVENGGVASRAMIEAGYSPRTAKTPKKLTDSKGFKQLMAECGLTEELVASSLVEDIRMKPQQRKPELDLAADILGMKQKGPATVVPIQVNISQDREEFK